VDVFQHDWDPAHHRDLKRWNAADPKYGAPPVTFTVSYTSGGTSYLVQFPQPFVISGNFQFEMVQSPDNSLRDSDALLGMVARAGSGDTVLVEQLYEYKYWGPTSSTPITDPNPRLEAYIAAAQRGALVRILLDSAYNDPGDPRGNTATCDYVNSVAASTGLDLACQLGNPTGTGIHNKMVLVRSGGQDWVHTGSINGSENSSKQNREMAVQVKSTEAYDRLATVFWYDYRYKVYLPVAMRDYPPASPASDLQIMALSGTTAPEYVTIENSGTGSQDMTGWYLVSVVGPQTFHFPSGYTLAPGATVRVESYTGAVDNPPAVLLWSTGAIWSNTGDKAVLYDSSDRAIDRACYGNACP